MVTELKNLSWDEAAKAAKDGRCLVIPIGTAAKSHGKHLPLGTDEYCINAICQKALSGRSCVLAPTIIFGYFPAFNQYPGTVSLASKTFYNLCHDILDSYIRSGFKKIFVIDFGVSTNPILNTVIRDLLDSHHQPIGWVTGSDLETPEITALVTELGSHADELETSLMLAIAPSLVKLDKVSNEPQKLFHSKLIRLPSKLSPYSSAEPEFAPAGHIGNPQAATAEKGVKILGLYARGLGAAIDEFLGIIP